MEAAWGGGGYDVRSRVHGVADVRGACSGARRMLGAAGRNAAHVPLPGAYGLRRRRGGGHPLSAPVGLQLGSPQDQVVVWGATINLVPFAGIARTVADAAQTGWWWTIAVTIVGGNVLMFVPLGFMLPLLSERFHRFRTTLFVLVACSAAIELAQLTVGLAVVGGLYRVVDVDDVILNVVGGSIGFGLWKAYERLRVARCGRRAD